MNFTTAMKTVLFEKYASFNGRACRSEFWWFYLGMVLLSLVVTIIEVALYGMDAAISGTWITLVFQAMLIIPNLSLAARRLHDTGRSGWNQLWAITIIGLIPLVYWYCSNSSDEGNRFGSNPLLSQDII